MTPVGERALAACRRPDGRYDIYYSQWAASDAVLAELLDAGQPPRYATLTELDWQYHAIHTSETLVQSLDYLAMEAVYLLSPAGLTVSLPVWLGFGRPNESVDPTTGVLVQVHSLVEYRQLRATVRFLKGVFRDGIRAGLLSDSCAVSLLVIGLRNYREFISDTATRHPVT